MSLIGFFVLRKALDHFLELIAGGFELPGGEEGLRGCEHRLRRRFLDRDIAPFCRGFGGIAKGLAVGLIELVVLVFELVEFDLEELETSEKLLMIAAELIELAIHLRKVHAAFLGIGRKDLIDLADLCLCLRQFADKFGLLGLERLEVGLKTFFRLTEIARRRAAKKPKAKKGPSEGNKTKHCNFLQRLPDKKEKQGGGRPKRIASLERLSKQKARKEGRGGRLQGEGYGEEEGGGTRGNQGQDSKEERTGRRA